MDDLVLRAPGAGDMSRRGFLGVVGAAVAATTIPSAGAATTSAIETVHPDKLGVQLWSCLAAFAADEHETLALLAGMGFTYVEHLLVGAVAAPDDPTPTGSTLSPKAFRKALDDAGLYCNGGHGTSAYPYNDSAWKKYVDDNLVIGTRYLGSNTNFPTTKAGCLQYVEDVHKAHDVARAMGHKGFQYNHLEAAAWNLLTDQPDTYAWEFIVQHTTHDVWNVELDTLHALQPLGSLDKVLHYIRKHPGRIPLFHMKDGGTRPTNTPAGQVGGDTNPTEFGYGLFGSPDPADPKNRPHAGFQDVLTVARETQNWSEVLLISESDASMATCADYNYLYFQGLNGLTFPYRQQSTSPVRRTTPGALHTAGAFSSTGTTGRRLAATGFSESAALVSLAALAGAAFLKRRQRS